MAYSDLSMQEKAQVIRMGVRAGLKSLKDIQSFYDSTAQSVETEPLDEFAEGGSIHIKHPGRLTALKERTGKSEAELWATGNAHTRKMITFARNARHWHADGGDTTQVYSNYMDAVDAPQDVLGQLGILGRMYARVQQDMGKNPFGSGISNCTLTATQWVDHKNPIMNAKTIVSNPIAHGYTKVSAQNAIPGDLIIAANPQGNSFHTMYIDGFDQDNNPLVRYSRGGGTPWNLVKGIPLAEYHRRDLSQEGNHVNDSYYRYLSNGIPLPEITVTPDSHSTGGPLYPFSFTKRRIPSVRY